MAQRAKFVDLTRTFLPIDPAMYTEGLTASGAENEPEKAPPVMAYEGYNFMPTGQGYRSYFGTGAHLNYGALPARCDWVFLYQREDYSNHLIALCDDGIYTKAGASSGNWVSAIETLPASTEETHYPWTYCVIENVLYMYRQNGSYVYRLRSTSYSTYAAYEIHPITPTHLNMSAQMGVFKAGGRLGMWDSDSSIAWSAYEDLTDFVPAIKTQANAMKFKEVKGRITTIKSHGDGFIIYATKSIVNIVRNLENTFLWAVKVVSVDAGVAYPKQVASADPDTTHFAWTSVGLAQIEGGEMKIVATEVYDYLKESQDPVYLRFLEGRHLFLEVIDPEFIYGKITTERRTFEGATSTDPGVAADLLGGTGPTTPSLSLSNGALKTITSNPAFVFSGNTAFFDGEQYPVDCQCKFSVYTRPNATDESDGKALAFYLYPSGFSGTYNGSSGQAYRARAGGATYDTQPSSADPRLYSILSDSCPEADQSLLPATMVARHMLSDAFLLSSVDGTDNQAMGHSIINYDPDSRFNQYEDDTIMYDIYGATDFFAIQELIWAKEYTYAHSLMNQWLNYVLNQSGDIANPGNDSQDTRTTGTSPTYVYWDNAAGVYKIYDNIYHGEELQNGVTRTFTVGKFYLPYTFQEDRYYKYGYRFGVIREIETVKKFEVKKHITHWIGGVRWCIQQYASGSVRTNWRDATFLTLTDALTRLSTKYMSASPVEWTNRTTTTASSAEGGSPMKYMEVTVSGSGDDTGYTYRIFPVFLYRCEVRYSVVKSIVSLAACEAVLHGYVTLLRNATFDAGLNQFTYTIISDHPSYPQYLCYPKGATYAGLGSGIPIKRPTVGPTFAGDPVTFTPPGGTTEYTLEDLFTFPDGSFLLQDGHPAPAYPLMSGAFIYDTHLKRWGKMKADYYALFDFTPINTQSSDPINYEQFGVKAAVLMEDMLIYAFDANPADSFIKYGKIGISRLGFSSLEEVIAQFRLLSTGTIAIEASLDGKAVEVDLSDSATFTSVDTTTLKPGVVAKWFNLILRGQWDLVYLEYRIYPHGRR